MSDKRLMSLRLVQGRPLLEGHLSRDLNIWGSWSFKHMREEHLSKGKHHLAPHLSISRGRSKGWELKDVGTPEDMPCVSWTRCPCPQSVKSMSPNQLLMKIQHSGHRNLNLSHILTSAPFAFH